MSPIESPCIGVCTIGAEGICTGCFRSRTEIATWTQWTPEQRRHLMAECLPRREALTRQLRKVLHPVHRPPSDGALNWPDIGPLFDLHEDPEAQFQWREAAVLIGLVAGQDGINVLLTQRTDNLRQHGGQVSFPGGARDPEDADIAATALREAFEEIGIPAGQISVVGYLDRFATISHFLVTPVVAWIDSGYSHRLNPLEVSDLFELPLDFLLDDGNYFQQDMTFNGHTRAVGEYVAYGDLPFRVWGATAAMMRQLKRAIEQGKQ